MAHCRLGCARRDTVLAEVGAEGAAHGVEVDRPAALVPVRDPPRRQVQVEALDQVAGHGGERLVHRQIQRQGYVLVLGRAP